MYKLKGTSMVGSFYRLIKNPGLVRKDCGERFFQAKDYIGKIGKCLEVDNDAAYTRYPTGYETVYLLLEFENGQRLYIPASWYCPNYDKDAWEIFLKEEVNYVQN
jgi:hypothetical protein